ncbi:MAG: hypothetical protein ACRDNM_00025 [Gaiellaceae bacterium]
MRIPLDVEVTEETATAIGALGEVLTKARDAGLGKAIARVVTTTREAVKAGRRRSARR